MIRPTVAVNFNFRINILLLRICFILIWIAQQTNTICINRILRPGCGFNVNEDWSPEHALILNKEMTEIIHPEVKDFLLLTSTEEMVLSCPGSQLVLKGETLYNVTHLTGRCSKEKTIKINGTDYNITSANCKNIPKTETKIVAICFNDSNIIKVEIGFNVENNFIKLITVCFDSSKLSTVYSNYKATPKIIGRQHGVQRPKYFDDAGFYHGIKIWTFYSKNRQRATMATILGSQELANKYIKEDTAHFLARGHLTAKADFIYGAEQIGTFYYINVAPQWQIINAGNWAALEDSVRSYVINSNQEISIYTIPYKVALLPDVNGVLQELYIYYEQGNQTNQQFDPDNTTAESSSRTDNLVPVPKFYIKILFNEKEKKGIAFVTVNNPYLGEITQDYILCDDICEKYPWLTWDAQNIEKGYSYCCSYHQLKNEIEYFPDLPISDVLD